MDTQNAFSVAVGEYLRQQPWAVRRKDTILAVAGGVLQVAQIVTVVAVGAPAWVPVVIGAVIALAQAVVHAFTPGAVTPSMAPRLEQAYVTSTEPAVTDGVLRAQAEQAGQVVEDEPYGKHAL